MKSEQMNIRISGWTRMDLEELAERFNVSKTDVISIALVSLKVLLNDQYSKNDYPVSTFRDYVESLFHLA